MNARMLVALCIATAAGTFAFAPAFAQNAMPASSSSTMPHDGMHNDAMKGSMSKHDKMMKHDVMPHGAMQRAAMRHDSMMKKSDSMKPQKDSGNPVSSGG
jgi:pentapeptide MXKDX repeat protein